MKFYHWIPISIFIFFGFTITVYAGAPAVVSVVLCDAYMNDYADGMYGEKDFELSKTHLTKLGVDHAYQLKDELPVIGTYGYEWINKKFGFKEFAFWNTGTNEFLTKEEADKIEKQCKLSVDFEAFNKEITEWKTLAKSGEIPSSLYFLPYTDSNWKMVGDHQNSVKIKTYRKQIGDWIVTHDSDYSKPMFFLKRAPRYLLSLCVEIFSRLMIFLSNIFTSPRNFTDYFEKRFDAKMSYGTDLLGNGTVKVIETLPDIVGPCPPEPDGPCGFDLQIVAPKDLDSNGKNQIFYFVEQGGAGPQYFGPFEDNLGRIIKEAKVLAAPAK